MEPVSAAARVVMTRCLSLAECTEEPGFITRTFLSEPMREVHARLGSWMQQAGMSIAIDAVGNIRGRYPSNKPSARRLFIGSHLDTVPRAGAYDGILGVVAGVALVQLLDKRRLNFEIEVAGFSEEEGLRFGFPFLGSRALTGTVDAALLERRDAGGITVDGAIRAFGLDPSQVGEARAPEDALGYLEFHIEQGPVLESLGYPLGIVEAIAGQTRLELTFTGQANHAGTTPMHLRRDALAGAAEWMVMVERGAKKVPGLVGTVGRCHVEPDAANVIPGVVRVSLDIRHADDAVRKAAVDHIVYAAKEIGERRKLQIASQYNLDQAAVAMATSLTRVLERAVASSGLPVHRMISGAGHDAMIVAAHMPAAMLFLRSPRGISHHASESVLPEDVAAALAAGLRFLEEMEEKHG